MEFTMMIDDPDPSSSPGHRAALRACAATNDRGQSFAENVQQLFDYHIPVANKADF